MDRFQDGHHVRLRSLVHRTYLHAADDGESVTLSQIHGSLNAVWAVHIYNGGDDAAVGCDYGGGQRLLLHSAAYGRYLAATATPARLGHRGLRAELRDYDQPGVEAVMWQAVGSGFGDDVVLLRNVGGRYLRANGRYIRWNAGVSVDNSFSSMMYWVVEPIPAREDMPALPAPPPNPPYGYLLGVIYPEPERLIRFVRALNDGHYPEDPEDGGWQQFWFRGRSAFRLRDDLGFLVGAGVYYPNIAMCVRAGRHGRLTPLVVDLPDGGYGETLEIVVFLADTPAYNDLRHPDVHAE
ncbi:hypothetical protein CFC21_027782 [Triticum aestivum]|uniref:DUF569 domain-containing protein n=3 Tax=Triticinae TaxID=1648030 RepID=A0A9R1JE80_WHEAT|nr:uncharacterized protein LOC123051353 [Triticum aestivum]KAF7013719.1 hypothetical protein CFC21_027782 [Triticum aestivum]